MKTAAKAIYAVLFTFITSTGALLIGDVGLGEITVGQWFAIGGGMLAQFGVVYQLGPAVVRPGNVQVPESQVTGEVPPSKL